MTVSKLRVLASVLTSLLVATAASAQVQSRAQQSCIKGLNKAGAAIAQVVGKQAIACVKAACKDKLPVGTTAEQCLTADPRGKSRAQRKTFVTPPFAAYFSDHSTYSRAAAEVLTQLTGSAYFPGGLGEFVAAANSFLKFEAGPTTDVRLQWATYYDAADQAGLSRIYGGIHPRVDDFTGRVVGSEVGNTTWAKALQYFGGSAVP